MILTKAIGIDLGTTNSAIAMLDLNERDLLLCKDKQGRAITPSCVWSDPRTGEIVVGHRAYARKGHRPEPISSIKRSMGTRMTIAFGKDKCSPVQISSYILRELKQQMEAELERRSTVDLHYEVSRAIITVPAYFSLPAIEATREAGQMAGLEVTELLHEPTAAAIYYSWKHNLGDGIYMVYDLGGGTFDVSILRRTAGEFLVLGISGDNFLGGDDFDRRLAEYLRTLLVGDYVLDLDVASDLEDRLRFNQLMALAEKAKKNLSEHDEFMLRDQGTLKDKSGREVLIETPISRALFEELIDEQLDRTLVCCKEALAKAHEKSEVTLSDVDHILLVGGSTYIPAVVEKVRKAFCQDRSVKGSPRAMCSEPIRDEPETAVALGAALRAAAVGGLGVSDDDRRIRLWFRSTGTAKRERTTISGQVEPLQQNLTLQGGLVRLTTNSGDLLGEVALGTDLRFTFPAVTLQAESLNEFRFEVQDHSGGLITVLQSSIFHASNQKEAVGRTLSTAVLPKPILLEGTDGNRLVRQVLLPEGTSLPAKAQFNFAVADPSGQVRLPIYQGNRIIKELQANVGKVPVGTSVAVAIACDQQVHIQVHFSIGDKEFGGKIEPPPPDSVPTEHEVQQLDKRFQKALQSLDEEDARRLKAVYQRTRRDLDEASAGADHAKVIQRAADLEGLIREARLAEPLEPSLEVVEKNFNSCLELLPKAVKIKQDLPIDALQHELKIAFEKAKQAYAQRDHAVYVDAVQIISTSLQFLASVIRVQITDDQDVDVAVRAVMALEQTRQLTQFLLIACFAAGEVTFFAELKQQLQELDRLAKKVSAAPVEVLNRCQVLITGLQRIYQQVSPEEKVGADIRGLLKVNTPGQVGDIGLSKGLFDQH